MATYLEQRFKGELASELKATSVAAWNRGVLTVRQVLVNTLLGGDRE
jgi:hypothetical protein